MKKHTDMLIFHTAVCAGASQTCLDSRREFAIRVAPSRKRSGMEINMDHARNMAEMLQIVQHYAGAEKANSFQDSCAEALRDMKTVGLLETEVQKMESEVERCYDIANQNAIYGLKREQAIWNARGQAFRDCMELINKCLKGGT